MINARLLLDGRVKLTNERSISDQYHVSRVTVRLALRELVADGLVVKRQAKGNYIAYKKIEHQLNGLLGFVEEFANRRLKCNVELIRKIVVEGEALGVDYTYVPESVAVILESLDFNNDIVYRHLEKNGYRLDSANQTIAAVMPNTF